MSATLRLAEQLLACPSATPHDAGCQNIIAERLAPLGFACESFASGPAGAFASNLWEKRPAAHDQRAQAATKLVASESPRKTLVFAGHTNVVRPGPLHAWASPAFTPCYRDGRRYTRGASDMKTALAALMDADVEPLKNIYRRILKLLNARELA